ncbi:MAG: EAL domain-containing protein [Amphritea sp.]
MTESLATDSQDALLKRIISKKRQRLRKNVHILFLGLSAEEADPITSLLRGARLAPRGKQVQSAREFTDALGERAWDLILSPQTEGSFTAKEAIQQLHRLNKDIPVIQLVPRSTCQSLLQGLKAKISAVIALEEPELLVLQVRHQLEHLDNRRRLKKVEAQLAQTEKQNQQLASLSELPIAYLSANHKPTFINQAFIDLFGLEDNDRLIDQEIDKFIAMKDRDLLTQRLEETLKQGTEDSTVKLTGRRIDGSNFLASFSLQQSRYLNQDCIQVIIHPDLHDTHDNFSNLDPITRLYDRQYILNKLEKAVQKALPGGADCSLLYIKFDNYSDLLAELNSKGSEVIMADLAELLRNRINKAHICARLEDGIFSVLFHDPSPDKAVKLAEILRRSIAKEKFSIAGKTFQTTCSIGICTINDNAPHYLELIDRARIAAEEAGGEDCSSNDVKLYQLDTPHDPVEVDAAAIQLIEHALENDHFNILFQPILGLAANNTLRNYEIFLRLQDEDNPEEEISPNTFLNSLEHSETCIKLDQWVISSAFAKVAKSLEEQQRLRVFINLTARTFQDNATPEWIQKQLLKHRIPADQVVFQVSESDMTTCLPQAQLFSQTIKKLGCKVCIKHFGVSGNSAILCKQTKPDMVKLDGSFIQDLGNSATIDKTFSSLIASLSEANILTIAPLVEDARLMGKLWKSGVDFIQGYYLQQPGPNMDYDFFE